MAESLPPPRDRLPSSVDGIPTDVIESRPAFLLAARRAERKRKSETTVAATASCSTNRQKQQRPVIGGISVAYRDITARSCL